VSAHEFRPAAASDIEQAYRWYERARKGLGEEFLQELGATVERVLAQPSRAPRSRNPERVAERGGSRAASRRLPPALSSR